MRVTSPSGKLGVALIGLVLSLLVGLGAGLGSGREELAAPVALIMWAGAVGVMARVFRGPSEASTPRRPWWRATARPGAGVLLAITFGASAMGALLLVDDAAWVRVMAFAVNALLACWYAHSSWRLAARASGDPLPRRASPSRD